MTGQLHREYPQRPVQAGRPPRLSHEQILDAALTLLRDGQGQDFSLRQLAQQLETAPANLYNYFPDKAALLDALADHALRSLDIALDSRLPWDQQLVQWMNSFRRALHEHPEILFLMGLAGTSSSTLAKICRVASLIREGSGLSAPDSVLQAQGLLWTVMSFALFETQSAQPAVKQQLAEQAAYDSQYRDILQYLAIQDFEPLWQQTLQRNINGIRHLSGKTP